MLMELKLSKNCKETMLGYKSIKIINIYTSYITTVDGEAFPLTMALCILDGQAGTIEMNDLEQEIAEGYYTL